MKTRKLYMIYYGYIVIWLYGWNFFHFLICDMCYEIRDSTSLTKPFKCIKYS
jgi:hypothetical protein